MKQRLLNFIEEDIDELISNICVLAESRNTKYKELLKRRENIVNNNRGLRYVSEDYYEVNLTEDEVKLLPKLFEVEQDIYWIEQHEIYKQAIVDCIDILKELNILKIDDDEE